MDINELRSQIDEIDNTLISAFQKRMDISAELAKYKKQNNLPVFDPARERQKLADITAKTPEDIRTYAAALYSLLFDLSRSYQEKILNPES
jgi:chorismate mutase/prephenate dehydratase